MIGAENWTALLPEIVLVGGAIILLILDAITPRGRGVHFAIITMIALADAAVLAWLQWGGEPVRAFADMIVVDRFGVMVRWIILAAAALATLSAPDYLRRRGIDTAEFYALVLLSTAGMTLLAVSADLIMVFLAVELLSLGLYVLSGYERDKSVGQEAAMKYFLLGAFASAFLLYGIAFTFGGAGTTNLVRMREILASSSVADFRILGFAVALLAVGLAFKAAMVPFHMWTPDVYQGAPTPVTAFMAGGTKAAAFGAVLRVLAWGMADLSWDWRPVLAGLSVATVIVGSVLAVTQTDVKRMLAYSSVAHAGFVGIAVVASEDVGMGSALMYLLVYTAMTVGAFTCLMLFRDGEGERTALPRLAGLGSQHPLAAAMFAFFLFSLAGIPPTGGFFAKFYVFLGAVRAEYTWLAVVGVLASAVSAFFYIRVAVVMFMQPVADGDEIELDGSAGLRFALATCVATIIAVAVAPGFFLDLAERAVPFS